MIGFGFAEIASALRNGKVNSAIDARNALIEFIARRCLSASVVIQRGDVCFGKMTAVIALSLEC